VSIVDASAGQVQENRYTTNIKSKCYSRVQTDDEMQKCCELFRIATPETHSPGSNGLNPALGAFEVKLGTFVLDTLNNNILEGCSRATPSTPCKG